MQQLKSQAKACNDEEKVIIDEGYDFEVHGNQSQKPTTVSSKNARLRHDDDKGRLNTSMKPLRHGGDGSLEGFVKEGAVAVNAAEVLDQPSKIEFVKGRSSSRRLTIVDTSSMAKKI